MKWIKKGLIFEPKGNFDWMLTHASNPTLEKLNNGLFRIYFSSRNENNESSIGYLDAIPNENFRIVEISKEPLLMPGELGTFDDSGVSISCILTFNGKKYMYYLGWNLMKKVPFINSIGLAVFDDESNVFKRYSKSPIIQRSHTDPYSISYPYVLEDGDILRMWYGSHLTWGDGRKENMRHVIKYAESYDGINWKSTGHIAIDLKEGETAISRPFVLKEDDKYKMFYSYRSKPRYCGGKDYRIGYAESEDGCKWTRKDEEIEIDISNSGWDSEMIEYPFVFKHKGKTYILYNGNGYGKTGFGYAILKE